MTSHFREISGLSHFSTSSLHRRVSNVVLRYLPCEYIGHEAIVFALCLAI